VISTVAYKPDVILDQKKLVDAAKRTGVKRFIPSDWATPGLPGVRKLFDDVRHIYIGEVNTLTFDTVLPAETCCKRVHQKIRCPVHNR
jgi:NmrA-like family